MTSNSVSALRRRHLLQAGVAGVASLAARASATTVGPLAAGSGGLATTLRPGPARVRMVGEEAGYVVDGHVPVATIRKLLAEKPAIVGITLPGMPPGSPGMVGAKTGPLTVYAISRDGTPPRVFAVD